jgi:hypothetical protein
MIQRYNILQFNKIAFRLIWESCLFNKVQTLNNAMNVKSAIHIL